jgi:hypothetical protein
LRDVGIFYSRAPIQRTNDVSPAFLEHSSAEKIAAGAHANRDPNKQEVGFIFTRSGSELSTPIKYSISKIRNQKPIAVNVLFKAYLMISLSCRSNLAGPEPDGTFNMQIPNFRAFKFVNVKP